MPVAARRIYEPPSLGDGCRVLIDGIWPRDITRERAAVDQWARELAPGAQRRRWYGHAPERFEEFARRYRAELGAKRERLGNLRRRSRASVVTLVFAARRRAQQRERARRRPAPRHALTRGPVACG